MHADATCTFCAMDGFSQTVPIRLLALSEADRLTETFPDLLARVSGGRSNEATALPGSRSEPEGEPESCNDKDDDCDPDDLGALIQRRELERDTSDEPLIGFTDDGYSYTYVDDVAIVKSGEEDGTPFEQRRQQNAFEPNVAYFIIPYRRRLRVTIPVLQRINAQSISSDGSRMAIAQSSRILVRDIETRATNHTLELPGREVRHLCFVGAAIATLERATAASSAECLALPPMYDAGNVDADQPSRLDFMQVGCGDENWCCVSFRSEDSADQRAERDIDVVVRDAAAGAVVRWSHAASDLATAGTVVAIAVSRPGGMVATINHDASNQTTDSSAVNTTVSVYSTARAGDLRPLHQFSYNSDLQNVRICKICLYNDHGRCVLVETRRPLTSAAERDPVMTAYRPPDESEEEHDEENDDEGTCASASATSTLVLQSVDCPCEVYDDRNENEDETAPVLLLMSEDEDEDEDEGARASATASATSTLVARDSQTGKILQSVDCPYEVYDACLTDKYLLTLRKVPGKTEYEPASEVTVRCALDMDRVIAVVELDHEPVAIALRGDNELITYNGNIVTIRSL